MSARYYLNLTDGDQIICDHDGLPLADVETAALYAAKAIEELRAEALASPDEWRDWRIEILNSAGDVVSIVPLVASPLKRRDSQ